MNNDFFDIAFKYALKAFEIDEVPIGAVVVKDNKVVGYGFNEKEKSKNVCSHAEINAIIMASKNLDNWRLEDCEIYVTLDPCPMCASAIKQARIKKVYSALSNLDLNNYKIICDIFSNVDNNPIVDFDTNILPERSKRILNDFFCLHRD